MSAPRVTNRKKPCRAEGPVNLGGVLSCRTEGVGSTPGVRGGASHAYSAVPKSRELGFPFERRGCRAPPEWGVELPLPILRYPKSRELGLGLGSPKVCKTSFAQFWRRGGPLPQFCVKLVSHAFEEGGQGGGSNKVVSRKLPVNLVSNFSFVVVMVWEWRFDELRHLNKSWPTEFVNELLN